MNTDSMALRQFVASPGFFGMGPKWSAKRSYIYMYGFVALLAVPTVVVFVLGRGSPQMAEKAGEMVSRVFPVLLPRSADSVPAVSQRAIGPADGAVLTRQATTTPPIGLTCEPRH